MDNELQTLLKQILNIGFWKLVYFVASLYILNSLKGFVKLLFNRMVLFFDKNVVEDRLIRINGIEGKIRTVGFKFTKIENGENNWFVPNDVMINSVKGYPKQKINAPIDNTDSNTDNNENTGEQN